MRIIIVLGLEVAKIAVQNASHDGANLTIAVTDTRQTLQACKSNRGPGPAKLTK
jgi:uncharacterized protein GlcG (DUF336 family)